MKKISLLLLVALLTSLIGCGKSSGSPSISFTSPPTMDKLKSYEGEIIKVRGFIATVSPLDGSLIYIMSAPFQSCPYCNTTSTGISNTITIYPKAGETFTYTNQPVEVTGKLVFKEDTDVNGYVTEYHLQDGTFSIYSDKSNKELTAFSGLLDSGYTDKFESALSQVYDSVNMTSGEPVKLDEALFDEIIEMSSDYDQPKELAERGKELVKLINTTIDKNEVDFLPTLNEMGQALYDDFYAWLVSYEV